MPGHDDHNPAASNQTPDEAVWTFRGYQMRPSEFNTAMVHLYRAEIQRSNVWRTRLDTTTNWAVVTAGAAITFALSEPGHHYVIILDTFLVTLFLWIEARRYRYYELWSLRARLLETDFFAAMLVPPFAPHPDWSETLAETILQPQFPITVWEALGRRLRRNYLWIYMILALAWGIQVFLQPTPATSWNHFLTNARIGPLPGDLVVGMGVVFNGLVMITALVTAGLHQATGEVLPKYPHFNLHLPGVGEVSAPGNRLRRWLGALRSTRHYRQQVLALVVSAQPEPIAQRIMREMRRGVTALHGAGMYARQEREVLLIALTVTEIAHLKAIVRAEDAHAFVIVTSASEVLGAGFKPLTEDDEPTD